MNRCVFRGGGEKAVPRAASLPPPSHPPRNSQPMFLPASSPGKWKGGRCKAGMMARSVQASQPATVSVLLAFLLKVFCQSSSTYVRVLVWFCLLPEKAGKTKHRKCRKSACACKRRQEWQERERACPQGRKSQAGPRCVCVKGVCV